MNPRTNKVYAFTLIELLVVLAMVALLAGLLLPAMANTRNNVKPTVCVSNLKLWAAAGQMYAHDNNDGIPRDGMGATGTYPGPGLGNGDPTDLNAWFNKLPQYAGETNYIDFYNKGGLPRVRYPFPGNGIGKIWMCPAATMSDSQYNSLSGSGVYGFFSYNFDIDLKTSATSAYPYPSMPKIGSLPRPSATVFMLDDAFNASEAVNASSSFNSVNPACRWKTAAMRHDGGGFIAFWDEHVQFFKFSYVTNGATSSTEALHPDIIWDPIYRAANP